MSETAPAKDDKTVIDKVQELADEFERESDLGARMMNGTAGYHTFFRRADGIDYAHETALHIALDEALMEVHVDPDMAVEFHGEFAPDTAAKMLGNQLEDFLGIPAASPFYQRLVGEYERVLEDFEEKLPDGQEAESDA